MAERPKIVAAKHDVGHGTVTSYVTGFALSVYLTLFAYLVVTKHIWQNKVLMGVIGVLAVAQFLVQALFFLHLGREAKPRWRQLVFVCMIGVVLILVFGSIWIMNNLNYHMLPPDQLKTYLRVNEGL